MTAQSASEVRTRFAPSPTGFLHIGGVRTALFAWLYARHYKGKFLLRIEDTDLERSEEHFTKDILSSLKWLGLNWDEEIVFQSKRLDVYRQKAEELLAGGNAYRCVCTENEVEEGRQRLVAEGKKPMYDRRCRELNIPASVGKPYVIRCKAPLEGYIEFNDLIKGPIRVENREVDDFVIVRSSGAPTYNLSVVVDDVHSRMTHVIRGDDHVNNTPKQIYLYQFFNYPIPSFGHLPMILGEDKKKLSKRNGVVSANAYRAEGYLPEALLNFLARLGWSHGDQEVFTIEELTRFFDFDHVQRAGAVFNREKLTWVNGEHLKHASPERLRDIVVEDFVEHFTGSSGGAATKAFERARTPLGAKLVALIQPKVKLVKEIPEQLIPLCTPGTVEVDPSGIKWNKDPALKSATQAAVRHVHEMLAAKIKGAPPVSREGADAVWGSSPALSDAAITHVEVDAILRQVGEQHGVKLGDLAQPLRLCVTGRLVSAGLFDLMALLPWDVVEPRLMKALEI